MEILIIQTAFIGDVALSVFFANEIKLLVPNAKITFISTEIGCQILKCFNFIDNPVCFDKRNKHKGLRGIHKLKKEEFRGRFDYIFVLHRSFRTGVLASQIQASNKIGFDTSALSFLLPKKIKYQKNIHEVLRNRSMLAVFQSFDNSFNYNKLVASNISSFNFITKIATDFTPPIIIAPGSVWQTKRWPVEYFVSLVKMLQKIDTEIYLIGAKQEEEICNYIAQETNAKSLANKTTIPQVLELIRNAKLVITNDSAPTHFASLFNIPTITIYGATSPSFGFYPLADNSLYIEDLSLFCHPCSIHGAKKCPRKNLECMENITPEIVFNTTAKIINANKQ